MTLDQLAEQAANAWYADAVNLDGWPPSIDREGWRQACAIDRANLKAALLAFAEVAIQAQRDPLGTLSMQAMQIQGLEEQVRLLTEDRDRMRARADAKDDAGQPVSFASLCGSIDSKHLEACVYDLIIWHIRKREAAEQQLGAQREQLEHLILVADGIHHDTRCPNGPTGDPQSAPCLRCQRDELRRQRAEVREFFGPLPGDPEYGGDDSQWTDLGWTRNQLQMAKDHVAGLERQVAQVQRTHEEELSRRWAASPNELWRCQAGHLYKVPFGAAEPRACPLCEQLAQVTQEHNKLLEWRDGAIVTIDRQQSEYDALQRERDDLEHQWELAEGESRMRATLIGKLREELGQSRARIAALEAAMNPEDVCAAVAGLEQDTTSHEVTDERSQE